MPVEDARLMVRAFKQFVEQRLNSVFTCAPVVIETVYRIDDDPNQPVYRVDVRPKWSRTLGTVKNCPVLMVQGANGRLLMPIKEGDVCLGFFSMFALDGIIEDNDPHRPYAPRMHNLGDCLVLPGFLTDSAAASDLGIPPGYTSEDLLLMRDADHGLWLKSNGDTIIGKLEGTLKSVLVDGDSNGAGAVSASQSNVKLGV